MASLTPWTPSMPWIPAVPWAQDRGIDFKITTGNRKAAVATTSHGPQITTGTDRYRIG